MAKNLIDFCYKHIPLSKPQHQIRLLTLLPAADENAKIECHLRNTNFLTESPKYEALSYVWGDDSSEREISIDDQPFLLWNNLYIALRYLRQPTEPRVLWIDAICINQNDTDEKYYQIMNMRDVYRSAETVIIWLGESNNEVVAALMVVDEMSTLTADVCNRASGEPEKLTLKDVQQLYAFFEVVSLGLKDIFTRPWWERVWVVQESFVCRKPPLAICGHMFISFQALEDCRTCSTLMCSRLLDDRESNIWKDILDVDILSLIESLHWNQGLLNQELQIHQSWRAGFSDEPIGISDSELFRLLLLATSAHKSTNPKDKIFALLGLLGEEFGKRYFNSYNMTISEIYQRATSLLFSGTSAGLDFLACARDKNLTDLPSWCIDFSRHWTDPVNHLFETDNVAGVNATLNVKNYEITYNGSLGELAVYGVELGRIARHVSFADDENHSLQMRTIFERREELSQAYSEDGAGSSSDDDEYDRLEEQLFYDILEIVCPVIAPFALAVQKTFIKKLGRTRGRKVFVDGAIWNVVGFPDLRIVGRYKNVPGGKDRYGMRRVERTIYTNCVHWRQATSSRADHTKKSARTQPTSRHRPSRTKATTFTHQNKMDEDAFMRSRVLDIMSRTIANSLFIISNTEYYGKASGIVQTGDHLCLLAGCSYPAILRSRNGAFRLIAFAFVPGIMNGELIKEFEKPSLQKFNLV